MAWIKLDDQFFMHPKVIAAGRDARDLYLAGLSYAAGGESSTGDVPNGALFELSQMIDVGRVRAVADRLVEIGLWGRYGGGYYIKDWLGCGIMGDPTTQEQRKTPEYERWRREVLERDNYTCVRCGAQAEHMHVHHILGFATHSKTRLSASNGTTLCPQCHKAAHAKERRNALD